MTRKQGAAVRVLLPTAVIVVLGGLVAGCGSKQGGSPAAASALKATSDGNFVLYVSDQSFALGQVDITVRIDGKVAVSDEFDVGNESNWSQYRFTLGRGVHHLTAITHQGHARIAGTFRIDKTLNGVVSYWYSPGNPGGERKLTFTYTPNQIAFA
jgi:hypothetical protein